MPPSEENERRTGESYDYDSTYRPGTVETKRGGMAICLTLTSAALIAPECGWRRYPPRERQGGRQGIILRGAQWLVGCLRGGGQQKILPQDY